MKVIELWSEEYFIDQMNRKMKYEIDMHFLVKYDRKPTKEEFESFFKDWNSKMFCEVTNNDLGKFD